MRIQDGLDLPALFFPKCVERVTKNVDVGN